jgi:hypothetical protein
MKLVKSLVLTLALTGTSYAGIILQPAPPEPPAATQQNTVGNAAAMLVAIVQALLPLR